MAILLKVKWVERSSRPEMHLRIQHIGGDSKQWRWKHTQAQAVEFIARGEFVYYVEKNAHTFKLDVARTDDGRKYLTLPPDAGQSQSLLDLPGFPNPAP